MTHVIRLGVKFRRLGPWYLFFDVMLGRFVLVSVSCILMNNDLGSSYS